MPKAPAEFDLYSESYSEQINQSLAFSGLSHDFYSNQSRLFNSFISP